MLLSEMQSVITRESPATATGGAETIAEILVQKGEIIATVAFINTTSGCRCYAAYVSGATFISLLERKARNAIEEALIVYPFGRTALNNNAVIRFRTDNAVAGDLFACYVSVEGRKE